MKRILIITAFAVLSLSVTQWVVMAQASPGQVPGPLDSDDSRATTMNLMDVSIIDPQSTK